LNIAEGPGKFSPADKAGFHATTVTDENKMLLEHIAQMLTQLTAARPSEQPGPEPAPVPAPGFCRLTLRDEFSDFGS
jgi:hypothetical protein